MLDDGHDEFLVEPLPRPHRARRPQLRRRGDLLLQRFHGRRRDAQLGQALDAHRAVADERDDGFFEYQAVRARDRLLRDRDGVGRQLLRGHAAPRRPFLRWSGRVAGLAFRDEFVHVFL